MLKLDTSSRLHNHLQRWTALRRQKQKLEAELREVNREMSHLEGLVVDQFADTGISSITIDGCTCYLQREFFCRSKEDAGRSALVAAFSACGMLDFLMPSYQSLRAHYRELAEDGKELPAELLNVLDVGDQWRLRGRNA